MEKGPQMPTPEEMAEITKKRMISDASLVSGGADIKIDEKGNLTDLTPTKKQMEQIEWDALSPEEKEKESEIKEQAKKEKGMGMEEKRNKKMMDDLLEARSRRIFHIKLTLSSGQDMEELYFGKINPDSVVVYKAGSGGIGYDGNTAREIKFNSIQSIGYYDNSVRFATLKGAFEKIVSYGKNGSAKEL